MRDVVITRVECSGPPKRKRNLEEQILALFPGLYRRLAPRAFRLSPRSRLRRALLRLTVVSGWAAWNRRDLKLMLVHYARDVEWEFSPGQQALGLGGTFSGHQGVVDGLAEWREVWDSWELEPAYILDLGDRLLNLGFAHARASGVSFKEEFVQLITVREGLVAHEGPTGPMQWEEGLRRAGLDPTAIALPRQRRERQATQS
jgi:ketosteroid isomerase-like protein